MIFRKRRRRVIPFVNITSLIDVMLILLIFFIITTRFVTQTGIQVNLPKANSTVKNVARESNTITISADKSIYLNRQKIRDVEELRAFLLKLQKEQGREEIIVIKADETVAHGVVVGVMDIVKTSGFSRIAIATR